MQFTHSYRDHLSAPSHYQAVEATPVSTPKLLVWSKEVASILGIAHTSDWTKVLAGNQLMPGMSPIATRYGGHQFGHWAGQLGDGRAILLGELNQHEIQLKGAGLTPYSRRGDGRAVLRSSVREYVCSEAMHFLGIPTTRALALVTTGDPVIRDMFYDGNPQAEPGAIVTRVAPSFVRFGHFQIHLADQDKTEALNLLNYVLRFYPGHSVQDFFRELCLRTRHMIVEWLRVGFVHGVMNTDNMSILGLTIDYGPYGWLDHYDPDWTPNTTDREQRRYRYSQQPSIALWNLQQLSVALEFATGEKFDQPLKEFKEQFILDWQQMMARKLGVEVISQEWLWELEALLREREVDMTIFYRRLADCIHSGEPDEAFYQTPDSEWREKLKSWLKKWRTLSPNREQMNRANPFFIPRNFIVQEAIEALGQNDTTVLRAIEEALKNPYSESENSKKFFRKRPEWARTKPGCSALSCSS